MSVRLIAVDMDGTFLRDNKSYDNPRFARQYVQMQTQGIRFVVASGNQYYQLRSFFPDIHAEIAFVAENGACVINQQQPLFVAELPRQQWEQCLAILDRYEFIKTVICGFHSAYIRRPFDEAFFQHMSRFYHHLQVIDNICEIKDTVYKFALNIDDHHFESFMQHISDEMAGMLTPVSSGHGSADLMIPGIHKANGIGILQDLWGISDEETVAFGDGGNDHEMLDKAGWGFVMANAADIMRTPGRLAAGHNNQDGVLDMIDNILLSRAPFNK
ncbi:sugar-phosphatase [Erwinia sp. OLTSP20]|uniref:Cof-type HAD-IIB family hydrolase n=1 Tax=unclassified Erwinia TaxID=2622719 RepID=UPI000C17EBC9|nr:MULTISPECIES: Cof-type HAD-IIB family hydrolase [unclassified Erwinia]PIJ51708.1 sugar-phosphatase [Erwinia sp. OAMSP11]PIJ75595.1 sugar-phosphatase [Erwinia sp. OLSSP12]PIJ84900.1 sugar-phosphatase [Erwinia sp. OLCASP19]PIJ86679.1 sugar-phosphatase [Erwinia sp. OLMTSP26]PIJ88120.1 sugar-phosphatase [Erwinia sp. OLMDSP33]